MALLDEILAKLDALPPDKLAELEAKRIASNPPMWIPNPGPQMDCLDSPADEIFFGGSAGGGKTALLLGNAVTRHKRSLILRKTAMDAGKLAEQMAVDIVGHREGYNSQLKMWRLPDGRVVYFGGCEYEPDKQRYKGDPHDFKGWDEVSDFPESVFRFINTWNRSKDPKQRCRVIAAGNPPTTPEGLWVIDYWGPWLNPTHPNPAQPGELRWYTTIAGKDEEVDGPGPHLIDGEMITARSRTFIRAMLADNPDLERTGYASVLAALPPELRDAYKLGKFDSAMKDHPNQLIPTQWIIAAQDRWKARGGPPKDIPMVACAIDVAQGGTDQTVLSGRHDWWYAPLVAVPGAETPMGSDIAALVIKHRKAGAGLIVDVGGGYGGATIQVLRDNGINVLPFNSANAGVGRTKCRSFGFLNKRAEYWWKFREALDPDQPGGSPIELPDDPGLRADLAAPHYEAGTRGIVVEPKENIKKRLGRSPDKGDAVVMCWSGGIMALRKGMVGAGAVTGRSREMPQFAQLRDGPLKKRAIGARS